MNGLARGFIRLYQLVLSPFVGQTCRYLPTCSDYADEAIRQHGLRHGTALAAHRLLRCHPWGGSGFDPVPAPHACRGCH
jgi:hypothetical protein